VLLDDLHNAASARIDQHRAVVQDWEADAKAFSRLAVWRLLHLPMVVSDASDGLVTDTKGMVARRHCRLARQAAASS
jgi:hypothetical protein